MSARMDTLDLMHESPFFEGMEREHLEHFARHARKKTFEPGDHVIEQGEPATAFYVLARGKIELSFAKPGADAVAPNEESGPEMDGQTLPHIVGHRGYPVGWASIVEPHRYRATALERTEMLVLDRELFEEYARERPKFGLAFMRRVLWLIGNHLRMTRTRLVAARYGSVPQTSESRKSHRYKALCGRPILPRCAHFSTPPGEAWRLVSISASGARRRSLDLLPGSIVSRKAVGVPSARASSKAAGLI